jgi:hypothetical protein
MYFPIEISTTGQGRGNEQWDKAKEQNRKDCSMQNQLGSRTNLIHLRINGA